MAYTVTPVWIHTHIHIHMHKLIHTYVCRSSSKEITIFQSPIIESTVRHEQCILYIDPPSVKARVAEDM